jgi:DNA replication protein DnaC
MKKKLKINIYISKTDYGYLWYENQSKNLQKIKRTRRRWNVLKTTQCKCANEIQCVKVNVQHPNNSCTPKKKPLNQNYPKNSIDNFLKKIINKQTFGEKNFTFKFGLKKFNLESYSHIYKNMKGGIPI